MLSYTINQDQKTSPIEFEKDDPTNFHIEFMGGVSNLRVILFLFRPETIKSRKLITSRSNWLLARLSQPLLLPQPWWLVLLVLRSSNIWWARKLKHTKMWLLTWLFPSGSLTIPLKLSLWMTSNSIPSCADLLKLSQAVVVILHRIYKMGEDQHQGPNDCPGLQGSLWEDLQHWDIDDHIRNCYSFLIIWQVSQGQIEHETSWGNWEGEQERDPQVQEVHLCGSVRKHKRRCGFPDARH